MSEDLPIVRLVDRWADEDLEPCFEKLVIELARNGVTAQWGLDGSMLLGEDGVTIAHSEIPDIPEDLEICVLGQRTLNRQQRLVLAERIGAPVARWIAPTDPDALVAFCDDLQTDSVVFKQDKSYRQWGVWLHRLRDPWPTELDEDADVFMEILQDDPKTYKVELFHDSIVGSRVYPTRSIFSPDFYEPSSPQRLFKPTQVVAETSRAIGREFLNAGCGYLSIDWMLKGTEYVIIEINSCGVGNKTWARWPQYLGNYAAAIKKWLESDAPRPKLRSSWEYSRAISRNAP